MTPLASYVLSLALATFVPGKSKISIVEMPECGTDKDHPTCEIKRICDDVTAPACNPPSWIPCFHGWRLARKSKGDAEPACHPTSAEPGAWARLENRSEGAVRYEPIAQAIADAATAHAAEWPLGAKDLARALLSASAWSTGLKQDIEIGRLRGPAGEVCLADMQLPTLRGAVPTRLAALPDEELVAEVVGADYDHLLRCYSAGATLIARVRRYAANHCRTWPIDYSLFAVYGMGSGCSSAGHYGDFAKLRQHTYDKFQGITATVFPSWYSPKLATTVDVMAP